MHDFGESRAGRVQVRCESKRGSLVSTCTLLRSMWHFISHVTVATEAHCPSSKPEDCPKVSRTFLFFQLFASFKISC